MFEIEEQIEKKTKLQEAKECLCCRPAGREQIQKQDRMVQELNENAPVKDELATHDGIVYFPAELMP